MTISMEEAAKRIHICAHDHLDQILPRFNIGQVYMLAGMGIEIHSHNIPIVEFPYPMIEHLDKPDRISSMRNKVREAINFLDENQDQDLLVHCYAGFTASPTFVLLMLLELQGEHQDLALAIKTLRQIKSTFDTTHLRHLEPYVDISPKDLTQAISVFITVKDFALKAADPNFSTHLFSQIPVGNEILTLDRIKSLCAEFGFELPTNIELCAADSGPPAHTPSSPHTPGCP